MATLVKASCPGCNTPLRIPADWIGQTIRCKQCQMVVQSRRLPSAAGCPTPPPTARPRGSTPPPPTRGKIAPVPAAQPGIALPPSAPKAIPMAKPVPTGTLPGVPLPSSPGAPSGPGEPFSVLGSPEPASATVGRTVRKPRRRSWKGPLFALGFVLFCCLTIAGVVGAALFTPLGDFLWEPVPRELVQKQQKQTPEEEPTPAKKPPTKKTPPKPSKPGGAQKPGNKDGGMPEKGSSPVVLPPRKPTPRKPRPKGKVEFPRRALIISVHNYLYANPIDTGTRGNRSMKDLIRSLNVGLRIPLTQIAHLSDQAARGDSRPPLKPVIEKSLMDFLASCRKQDQALVFFVGHSAEMEDQAYLVPAEGEFEDAKTLIPLKWVLKQLADCKARQKVLVLDAHRYSPAAGMERPDSGKMGEMFQKALKAPPKGVQVWAACSPGQRSYATEEEPFGLFLAGLSAGLTPYSDRGETGALEGTIQRPHQIIPVGRLNEHVNKKLKADLKRRKLEQQAQIFGSFDDNGATFDPDAEPAPLPRLAQFNPKGGARAKRLLAEVRQEISTPPVKPSRNALASNFDILPPFDPDKLRKYEAEGYPNTDLKKAIAKARAILWAVSTTGAPPDLADLADEYRKKIGVDLSVLRDGYRVPGPGNAETQFKARVRQDEVKVADIMLFLQEALDELELAGEKERDKAPLRWQANYDFIHARLRYQIAFLYEYQSALGGMRIELPPRPEGTRRWQLAANTFMQGDRAGRKLAKYANRTLENMVEAHEGTPWEVLAKRQKFTALGLKWVPVAR